MLLNESKVQGRDPKTAFVRDVRVGAEPFCVVGTNRQLDDLKRFCCNPVEYRPLTEDPTFGFGPYNVTPISYQHLITLRREDGKRPPIIGSVLLHEKKTQHTYSLSGGTLKSLEPELKNLMAFGTDDEKALVGGFNATFERATRLLCEIHLRKNIDTKLVSMDIKGESKQSIMDDIFGRKIGSVFESGLLDTGSAEEFTGLLESPEKKWSLLRLGDKWAKVTNDHRKEALSRVHHIGPEEASPNSVASVNKKLVLGESVVFQQILSAGVDWITPDVLKVIVHKGEAVLKEGKVTKLLAASAYDTLIIPSKSKPTNIIVVYPNGKVECQDCQEYSASYLCAHAVAASLKRGTLEVYLKWLVANKRNTGGLNYSRAIAFGMPTGRGRKGERQPRSRRGKQTTIMVIPRNPLPSAPSIGANECKKLPGCCTIT